MDSEGGTEVERVHRVEEDDTVRSQKGDRGETEVLAADSVDRGGEAEAREVGKSAGEIAIPFAAFVDPFMR